MLTIDPTGDGHHASAGRSPTACRPTTRNLVARALRARRAHRRACTSTSRSPTAAGSAAARPTPRRSCAGPASTTSSRPPRLGADVPFCLVGGRARVRGIGEIVEPLPPRADATSRWSCPPLHVSTPAVYRAWDELGGPTGDGPNDLEPAALVVEPALARVARPHRRARRRARRCSPAAARRGSCRASATTPSPPCGARALRWCVARTAPAAAWTVG